MDDVLEEPIARIEIVRERGKIIINVHSELGGFREYSGRNFHEALRQMSSDLVEEVDKARMGDFAEEPEVADFE